LTAARTEGEYIQCTTTCVLIQDSRYMYYFYKYDVICVDLPYGGANSIVLHQLFPNATATTVLVLSKLKK